MQELKQGLDKNKVGSYRYTDPGAGKMQEYSPKAKKVVNKLTSKLKEGTKSSISLSINPPKKFV